MYILQITIFLMYIQVHEFTFLVKGTKAMYIFVYPSDIEVR